LTLIAVITLGVAGAAARLHDAPNWWRHVESDSDQTIELANRVERAVLSHVRRPRPLGKPWTVAVNVEQANAWLAVRLPMWASNRSEPLPAPVQQIQANFVSGRVSLGVQLAFDDVQQVVATTFTPTVRRDGSLWLVAPQATAGRLDLPRDWTIARLREWLPTHMRKQRDTAAMLSALAGRAPLFPDASVKLEDGTRVRLLGVRVVDGDLALTCVNERLAASAARSRR